MIVHLVHVQEWWTHLWLNEGFASWIEYLCVDHCFPEYDIWTQFATSDYTRALELDALKSSHPIEVSDGSFVKNHKIILLSNLFFCVYYIIFFSHEFRQHVYDERCGLMST